VEHIKAVIKNGDDIELLVHCPHHNGDTVLFDEDTDNCIHCGNELEQVNIAAWEEYHRLKPAPTVVR